MARLAPARAAAITALAIAATGWLTASASAESIAGKTVKVRLLAAGGEGAATANAELQDVLPHLRSTLRFDSYRLVSTSQLVVNVGGSVKLDGDLSLTVTGIEGETLTAEVRRGDKRLVQTRLKLRAGSPISLGGFSGAEGENLIIVVSLP